MNKHIITLLLVCSTHASAAMPAEGDSTTAASQSMRVVTFKAVPGTERTYYYHHDHLGSTTLITNDSGNVVQRIEYLPYGEVFLERHGGDNHSMPYKFNGKEYDEETGLYYYGARYYDPHMSMWLGTDPMQGKYPGVSTYAYCMGNPIRLIDPDGKMIKPHGYEAFRIIQRTIPKSLMYYVQLDRNGFIDVSLLNRYQGDDYNLNCLKEIANNPMIVHVYVDRNAYAWKEGKRGHNEVKDYQNPYPFGKIDIQYDSDFMNNLDDLSTKEEGAMGKTLFPDLEGIQNSPNNDIHVYINPLLSQRGKAEIYSHEVNGHVLLYFRTRYDHWRASHHERKETNDVLRIMIMRSKIETYYNY